MKRYIKSAGSRHYEYVFVDDWSDYTPLADMDTGSVYRFNSEEEAQDYLDTHSYLRRWYPNIRVHGHFTT